MRRIFGWIVVVGLLVLAWVGSASAFELCLSLSNFSNRFKFEVTPLGGDLFGPNFFQLTGSERAFADRAVSGTAFSGSSDDFRFGFLLVANNGTSASDVIVNASLSRSALSGSYTAHRVTFNDDVSGTISVISCADVDRAELGLASVNRAAPGPSSQGGLDVAGR
jgi:hypothetical protein